MRKAGIVAVEVTDEDAPGVAEVDSKLRRARPAQRPPILTNDLNLNRIAGSPGRAASSTSTRSPTRSSRRSCRARSFDVRVIQPGKDPGQGVGYLDDGTMVVVEGGAKSIDSELDVTVTRVLQTVAGRMIFAQLRHD